MRTLFAQVLSIQIPAVAAFAATTFIVGSLVSLHKVKAWASPYLGNQLANLGIILLSLSGCFAGVMLGLGLEPEGLWTDLLCLALAAVLLRLAARFLGHSLGALRRHF